MAKSAPEPTRLVLCMVGLPARGKTWIARKIARYLAWLGYNAQVFNAGDYRRKWLGAGHRADFFDPRNDEGARARSEMAELALADLLGFMRLGGEVALYDATNTTRSRRDQVRARCSAAGCTVVFVESVCEDPSILEANIRETKLSSPDYAGIDPEDAVRDFRQRIDHYAKVYEPVHADEPASSVRLIDVGRIVVLHRIEGYLPARLVSLLINLHVVRRPIWLTRHGESTHNVEDRIGGDPDLSPRGHRYAAQLARFVRRQAMEPPVVWCSTLRRTIATCAPLAVPAMPWRALDEIDAGVCDGLTYREIAERMPDEYAARRKDKLRYRYPRGESYEDVIERLEPVIIECERQRRPVVIVAHQAVLRALYSYFMDLPRERAPFVEVPLHTLIELVPAPYGYVERRHALAIEAE
ncbi:MAG: fructose-2,6-bisphosphatase [Myxococcales bacterium]|nr:fructose-2,6-bisphosphatase [Myxococcales bacterium]